MAGMCRSLLLINHPIPPRMLVTCMAACMLSLWGLTWPTCVATPSLPPMTALTLLSSSFTASNATHPPNEPSQTTLESVEASASKETMFTATSFPNDLDNLSPLQRSRPPNLVRLGVILPFTGSHPWVLPQTLPAILLAVEKVTNHSALLANQTVHVTSQDSKCSETIGPLAAIDMYFNQSADVFLGPACPYSVAPVARFSHFWGIPVLTAGGLVSDLKNKTEYKMLTRVQVRKRKLNAIYSFRLCFYYR